ncbi:hypothetical protein [Aestuariimicrobium kwangyangense]|uniref:hypothetical protein n=1 Tax=Aestuariimicrobium kwangyangense TaxID=396389 RepID=UPI0012F8D6F4|nr:hypothetical protein [Aestuariimicrobium kwangyangense]
MSGSVGEAHAAAFRALVPVGSRIGGGGLGDAFATVLDISAREQQVLVTFSWMAYPHRLAHALGPHSEYRDDDAVVAHPAEWAEDAATWLDEQLGTGLVFRAARQARGDALELVEPDWPFDSRFYVSSVDSLTGNDGNGWTSLNTFDEQGFDTAMLRSLRADGSLISWERASVDDLHGSRWVGHAGVAAIDAETAGLVFCQTLSGVPDTVLLELCLGAAHQASWRGARRVVTDLEAPVLDVLGFRRTEHGRELDTRFLDVDHSAAARVLDESRDWSGGSRGEGRFRRRWGRPTTAVTARRLRG